MYEEISARIFYKTTPRDLYDVKVSQTQETECVTT